MANLNKVFLMGNLTRDPELKYLPSGTAVAEFGMAINRRWTNAEGQQQEEVCYVDINMFGRRAEVICEYLSKGRPIFIEGRLRFDSWEGQDGQKRSKLRVVADNFQFIGGRSDSGAPGGQASQSQPPQQQQSYSRPPSEPPSAPPSQAPPQKQTPPTQSGEPTDLDAANGGEFDIDGEVPF